MSSFPRVAVGTIQPGFDCQPVVWALMEALRRERIQVQDFLSRACFPSHQGAASITGRSPRHLDSWLMSPRVCHDTFLRASAVADFAVVEGTFDPAAEEGDLGGKLETLCHWLNLPKLVVLDASRIAPCRLPDRPDGAEGLLLDRVGHLRQRVRLTTELEALWGIPVLGALEKVPQLDAQIEALPRGGRLPRQLCDALGDQFVRFWQPERIFQIASQRDLPEVACRQRHTQPAMTKLTLAVAYDEAFNCYFPDTLEWLEQRGASVVDFSPLRDETLPPETDIVYLGCGHPERHAAALSENHCMKASLRSHVRAGRRIYGEGGGLAYLCQQMETSGGGFRRMVGIVPAIARLKREPTTVTPVEITLAQPTWLGEPGSRLRGYRNAHWELEPVGLLADLAAEARHRHDLVGSFLVIGSLLHLDFAAQPEFLHRFFHPALALTDIPDPWAPVS